jgi:FkbM family methyltransferase
VLGSCPRCGRPLDVADLHFAGWRSLVRGSCGRCHRRFLQDLPTGHALLHPASLDLDSGEILAAPGSEWFSAPLRDYWAEPDGNPVALRVSIRREVDHITILNCLDVVDGHEFLKLLNTGRELDLGNDVAVIVSAWLADVVPAGVAELWTVDASPGRLRAWLLDLETSLQSELDRFESARLSPAFPHPHPSTYRLTDFTGRLRPESVGSPSVVLSLRDDRPWGRTVRTQMRNVGGLCRHLERRFPDAGVVAIGKEGGARLPDGVVDRRSAGPTSADVRAWLGLAAGADLVIGVHGPNLLLPSGLAPMTLELVPRGSYHTALDAILPSGDGALEALWRRRLVYGDAVLADVTAERVSDIAAAMLTGEERFRTTMLGPLSGRGGELPAPVEGSDAAAVAVLKPGLATQVRQRAGTALSVARHHARQAIGRLRAQRGSPPPRVMTDRRGLRYEMVSRQEIGQFLVDAGHFEGREIEFLVALAEPGDVVLDVGANIGHFTAPLARAVGPEGTVHAFEPIAISRGRLERTLELNGLGNVIINPVAVGATNGSVDITTYGPGFESWATTVPRQVKLGFRVVEPVEVSTVDLVTLDGYCERRGIEHVAIAKIDAEGAEPAVMDGAAGLLGAQAVDLLLFELSDIALPKGVMTHDVIDRVTRHGYRTFVLKEDGPVPFRSAGYLPFANVLGVAPAALERFPHLAARSE